MHRVFELTWSKMLNAIRLFNSASYALLTNMWAQRSDLDVGDFIWTGGDCHLYLNHLEQADEQLQRKPMQLPRLAIKRRPASIFDYAFEDFEILNYQPHAHIKAAVAV
jgi:thymidylate synthase